MTIQSTKTISITVCRFDNNCPPSKHGLWREFTGFDPFSPDLLACGRDSKHICFYRGRGRGRGTGRKREKKPLLGFPSAYTNITNERFGETTSLQRWYDTRHRSVSSGFSMIMAIVFFVPVLSVLYFRLLLRTARRRYFITNLELWRTPHLPPSHHNHLMCARRARDDLLKRFLSTTTYSPGDFYGVWFCSTVSIRINRRVKNRKKNISLVIIIIIIICSTQNRKWSVCRCAAGRAGDHSETLQT